MGRTPAGPALFALAATLLLLTPAAASGRVATTLGSPQSPTAGGSPIACSPDTGHVLNIGDYDQSRVRSGSVITQWKFLAGSGGGSLALQTLVEGPLDTFTAVAESPTETPVASTLNTFATRIPVTEDVRVALRVVSGSPDCLYGGFPVDFNETIMASPAPLVGGGAASYDTEMQGARLNLEVAAESDDDRDGYGDQTQDGCTDRPERHDDCVKPLIQLDETRLKKRGATMFFSSNEPGSSFECHLEDKNFKPCSSPLKYKRMKPGLHVFTVRTIDANHNVSTTTSYRWRVKKPRRG